MSSLSYTTGNPTNLTAGTTASMTDISGPFTDIRTWANGNVDGVNAPAIVGAYGETLLRGTGRMGAGNGPGTVVMKADAGPFASGATDNSGSALPMHVALAGGYSIAGVTTKLRVRAWAMPNTTAPAINFTFGLYPITTNTGSAGVAAVTVGSVIAGSTVAINTPAAQVVTAGTGTEFNYSLLTDATGYVLCVVLSGTTAASSCTDFGAILEMHHS